MRKIIRVAMVLTVIVVLSVATAAPAMAAKGGDKGPPEKTTIVAPTVGGQEDGTVKAPVAMVPDKSTHPVFETNPAFGGIYPGEGAPSEPGTVFWIEDEGGPQG